jgi:beta-1,4-N-acetylglucosaminyltransferase
MQSLKKFWSSHQRTWVTDLKADTVILKDQEQVYWLPYQSPRDVMAVITGIPAAFKIIAKEKPDLVISTGASIAINFGLAAKALGVNFTYIESISRSKDLSLTGKIVYPLCSDFYVQWPNLAERYSKALFKGFV